MDDAEKLYDCPQGIPAENPTLPNEWECSDLVAYQLSCSRLQE